MNYLLLLVLAFVVMSNPLRAQIPNGDFEQWVTFEEGEKEIPVGWMTSYFGSGKSEDAPGGRFAATVWNWYYYAKGYLITGGSRDASYLNLDAAGMPVSFKPMRLSGLYRYEFGSNGGKNDSAMVLILLKKYNPERRAADTVAFVETFLPPTSGFVPFNISLPDRMPGVMPDSVAIAFVSSVNGFCEGASDGNCCYLSVDDITLSTASGVSQSIAALLAPGRVVPNPVRSSARIEWGESLSRPGSLLLYGTDGRLVRRMEGITGSSVAIERNGLPAGEYLYELRDENGRGTARGRFVAE